MDRRESRVENGRYWERNREGEKRGIKDGGENARTGGGKSIVASQYGPARPGLKFRLR